MDRCSRSGCTRGHLHGQVLKNRVHQWTLTWTGVEDPGAPVDTDVDRY